MKGLGEKRRKMTKRDCERRRKRVHLVLKELHVVAAERHDEDDGRHIVKALDPFAPL
jgi:hypothetical protein